MYGWYLVPYEQMTRASDHFLDRPFMMYPQSAIIYINVVPPSYNLI